LGISFSAAPLDVVAASRLGAPTLRFMSFMFVKRPAIAALAALDIGTGPFSKVAVSSHSAPL